MDDHALFRESLSRLLAAESDLEMAGHCATLAEALEILKATRVDLVLLDADLGADRGLDLLGRAREQGYAGKFLMLTAGMTDVGTLRSLDLGASGIVLKHSQPVALLEAIRTVAGGANWVDPLSTKVLVLASHRESDSPRARKFTERERQVLRAVFEGFSNKEIAAQLMISESSVKAAIQQLFHKTGVRTRTQLVRIALEDYVEEWDRPST